MQLTPDMKTWVESKIEELTLEEKAFLLSGVDIWRTHAVPRLEIPQLKVRSLSLAPRNRQFGGSSELSMLVCLYSNTV